MSPASYDIVRPDLPAALADLNELALDLRWSWSHVADALWRQVDAERWRETQNPWLILQTVSQARLRELAGDAGFLALLQQLRREQIESRARGWLAGPGETPASPRVAYFCMEYGITEALPIYSGGLGVLAGDHLKSSSEAGIELTAVGLLYQQGYFRQGLDDDGRQIAFFPYNDPTQLPVVPARDDDGRWVEVAVELPGRELLLRVWQAQIGRVRLLLLDSNSPLNSPPDRGITAELYGGGNEIRLQQEMVLGIGGVRALRALGIDAQVFHLNEGHAALAVLERARQFMEARHCSFDVARTVCRAGNLFTTHTPVAAGFDRFEPALFCRYLAPWAQRAGLDCDALLPLGRCPDHGERLFNMAMLALRESLACNGVSRLHERVSQRLFADAFPRWPLREIPIGHVTNGVHVPTWDADAADALWTRHCGKERWRGPPARLRQAMARIDPKALWDMRGANRRELIDWLHQRRPAQTSWGCGEAREPAARRLDPNALTLGFARRFADYKRPNLLLHDPPRLARLLSDPDRPVQLIIAGKAHPADSAGQAMIRQWIHFIRDYWLEARVVFVIDYDLAVARRLVQGVDLWLNTPRRPWEASGTSGMKVLVNGGLHLSTLDGWWAEAWSPELGYALGDGEEHEPAHDADDAQQLYDILEREVIPAFYERDTDGIPRTWVERLRNSMATLTPMFSTSRMIAAYYHDYYRPLADAFHQRARDDAALARRIVAWRQRTGRLWDGIHIGAVAWTSENGRFTVTAQVYLGELTDADVAVQLFADPRSDDEPPEIHPMTRQEKLRGAIHGYRYRTTLPAGRPADDYTVRVVPRHEHARVPLENSAICWAR